VSCCHVCIPFDFFQDIPKEISIYSSQIIFSTLYSIKQKYHHEKSRLEDLTFKDQSLKEKYEATISRYETARKDLLTQLDKMNVEIDEVKQRLEEHIQKTKGEWD
jgi:hypothetical protein